MRPALHVVRFKYWNRFHPSVEQIHRWTETDFITVQINTSQILRHNSKRQSWYKTRTNNSESLNIPSGNDRKCKLTTTRGLPYGFPLQFRAMTSQDHLELIQFLKICEFGCSSEILHTFSSFSNRWLHNNNMKELSSHLFKDLVSLDDLWVNICKTIIRAVSLLETLQSSRCI